MGSPDNNIGVQFMASFMTAEAGWKEKEFIGLVRSLEKQ